MRNLFYLLLFAVLFVSFSGCKNNDNVDEAWRTANANAYDAITKNPAYHPIQTDDNTGPSGVYYKDISTIPDSLKGTVYPLQTSDVKILYKVTYCDSTVLDAGTSLNKVPIKIPVYDALGYTAGYGYGPIYYGLYQTPTPRGFSFALQHMVVGDKWEIWIPYYLAHGAIGLINSNYQTVIKGYTTLIFTVELVGITEYPK